jgi:ASC-1-like (ASCH) protein
MTTKTNVKVELSFTRNLGNFESIKINIGIEDFQREGENIDEATNRVYNFVEGKLMEKVNEIESELKSNKGKK